MPYPGVSEDKWPLMEKCVTKVMAQGHDKSSAIAICHTSIVGKSAYITEEEYQTALTAVKAAGFDPTNLPLSALKVGARHSQTDMEMLQQMHDNCVELGAQCPTVAEQMTAMANGKSLNITYIKSLHLSQDDEYFRDVLAVKSTGSDSIHGYLTMWGDESKVDVENEFFTKSTDFWDKQLGLPRPLTWDHAQDGTLKSTPVIGDIVQIGDDEIGRWYDAQLNRAHQYRKAIDKLISQREIGTSSDSAPQYVQRERTKSGAVWLKQWPLFAGALTTTPCEPRMLTEGSPIWKSIVLPPQTRMGEPDGSDAQEQFRRWLDIMKLSV